MAYEVVWERGFYSRKTHTLGKAIAQWSHQKYHATPHMLMVHDTRVSGSFVKAALKTGLLHYPLVVEDAGVLPTPASHIA